MVQGAALTQRDADHRLLGFFGRLADGFRHFTGLTVAEADAALLIANHHQGGEGEATAAFDGRGDAVDVHQLFDDVALRSGFGGGVTVTAATAFAASADKLNISVAGGGTHPFQQWHERRIYDKPRFRELSELYGYLSKQFTIFGQHVHIGCPDADTALLLLHRMSRYIPHFIALSASSPFVQGQDTQFDSARLNSVFAFPMSGRAPFTLSWDGFSEFFEKTTRTGVVKSMKDFYWDIRPKPEFGTIEIRVFDTPLTVERAAALAGFVQSLASWLMHEQPFMPQEDDYMVYTYNRFQACRFGLEAVYVDPVSGEHMPLRDHIKMTMLRIADHARQVGAGPGVQMLREDAELGTNDARWLREKQARERLLAEVVRQGAEKFRGRV